MFLSELLTNSWPCTTCISTCKIKCLSGVCVCVICEWHTIILCLTLRLYYSTLSHSWCIYCRPQRWEVTLEGPELQLRGSETRLKLNLPLTEGEKLCWCVDQRGAVALTSPVRVTPAHLTFPRDSHILNVYRDQRRHGDRRKKSSYALLLARKYTIHIKEAQWCSLKLGHLWMLISMLDPSQSQSRSIFILEPEKTFRWPAFTLKATMFIQRDTHYLQHYSKLYSKINMDNKRMKSDLRIQSECRSREISVSRRVQSKHDSEIHRDMKYSLRWQLQRMAEREWLCCSDRSAVTI